MTDPLIGRLVGRYQLQQLLGTGGTARVYRALDQSLKRDVAVKILNDDALLDPEFIQRFDREARTLAGLRHSNIVQIYDYGQQDGLNYIVTQFIPGQTLEEELDGLNARGQRMATDKVIQTLTQISSALDYAHAQGIVHRDIKPGNVIRDSSGDAVLTDFGIAKAAVGGEGVTQVGTVIGTPAYLSPQQAQGTSLSAASDIYALGILAYELLTGRAPFEDDNPMSVLLDHVQTPPPAPSTLRPDLPVAVDQAVLKALAKDPSARFPSAGAFVRALGSAWATPVAAPAPFHSQPTTVNPAYVPPVAPATPPVDIHNQQTAVNQIPPQPRPQAVPRPAPSAPAALPSQPKAVPAQPKVYRHTPWPLFLGLLLGLLLIGGVVAALRNTSDDAPVATLPSAVPTQLPATSEPTVEPPTAEPTEAQPTAEPTSVPTELSTQPPAPTEPAAPSEPPAPERRTVPSRRTSRSVRPRRHRGTPGPAG